MPPSAKTERDEESNHGGFPNINASRRQQAPPKLKKPVPHYRHLVRWSKNQVPESLEEQQMNQDLVILRHALDLFLNSHMTEAEAILARGPVPVDTNPSLDAYSKTAAQKAQEAFVSQDKKEPVQPKPQEETTDRDDLSSLASSEPSSSNKPANGKTPSSSSSSSSDGKKSKKDSEPTAMYYELGKAIIQGLRALVTFDPYEIEAGMKAFEKAIKVSNKQRKGSMMGLGSVKAVGSFVVGTIGAGSFRGMNRVQKHAVSLNFCPVRSGRHVPLNYEHHAKSIFCV